MPKYKFWCRLSFSTTYGDSYTYNVRGWTTGITNGNFTQSLTYNNGTAGFNGNITAMTWTAGGSSHSYAFTYDGLNRMLDATHDTNAYTEKVTGYDKNGNITGLQRYGNGLIDNLTYTYNGNRLTKVEDATGNATGFTDGASQANEYTYDNNGNLTQDLNKGITNISYNFLNLPQQIRYSNGVVVNYGYSADGVKQRVQHLNSGLPNVVYCGNVIYEGDVAKLLLTEEGYVDLANGNAYYYYLKDHQGNNRVVLSSSGTVMETNHYYPFGSTFATSNVQPYKYNGKELDTKAGLNWYDYGARHYDATLGRWHVVDPLSYNHNDISPYSYCLNNPLKFVDPDGKDAKIAIKGNTITITSNIVLTGPKATKELAQSYQKNIMDNWGQLNTYVHNEVIYDIVWDVNVRVAEEGEMLVHDGTNNFMEVVETGSWVKDSNYGEIRGKGWNGKSLDETNPMAHEFGHMLGLKDKYQKIGENDYVTRKGWKGNIMGEFSGEGKVEMKNINIILPNAIDYLKSIDVFRGFVPWLIPNYMINANNRE